MIGRVLAIAKGGAGIVRDAGRTVFVPGVVAGETVEFSVRGRLRSAWRGELLQVLEASPQRVVPPCPHYGSCGGCNLQHMSYEEQLRSKAQILLDNLTRIAGAPPPAAPGILASPPERYRSKGEFQVRGGVPGFFARESHRVVAVSGCLLLPQAMEDFFLSRRPALAACENAQLQVVSNGRDLAARLETSDGRGEWFGAGRTVRVTAGSYEYDFAPGNFIQANLFQHRPMLELLEGVLERERPVTAADLFCGAGFFTLPLAARCREIWAMESDPGNIAALRSNLELNGAGHVRVVEADVLHAAIPALDLVVVDPPRGGLSPRLVNAISGSGARRVVYFSCDSATFARDLRLFIGSGYGLADLRLVDNFPHSDHFEIFSVLKKK